MESSSKRRKIAHADAGIKHKGLIDFANRNTTQVSAASTFILQTDELLAKTKLDYSKTLGEVDGHLHNLKTAIEAIPAHEPLPVCGRFLLM
jgi:U3 small nucleolar RNA-associated protein 22